MKIWSYSQSHRIEGKGLVVEKANKYLEACEIHGNSPDSVRTYNFGLMTFFRWFGEDWKKFEKFTQKDVQDWMTHLKKKEFKPNTINQRLVCIRGFYKFCFGNHVPHVAGVLYPSGYYRNSRTSPFGNSYPRRKLIELRVKVPHRIIDHMYIVVLPHIFNSIKSDKLGSTKHMEVSNGFRSFKEENQQL